MKKEEIRCPLCEEGKPAHIFTNMCADCLESFIDEETYERLRKNCNKKRDEFEIAWKRMINTMRRSGTKIKMKGDKD